MWFQSSKPVKPKKVKEPGEKRVGKTRFQRVVKPVDKVPSPRPAANSGETSDESPVDVEAMQVHAMCNMSVNVATCTYI